MQLVMVGNQHQRSYGEKTMKAQNTINLGQISGEMKTWNTFILGSKIITCGVIDSFKSVLTVQCDVRVSCMIISFYFRRLADFSPGLACNVA